MEPGVSAGSGFIPTIFAAVTLVSTVLVIISDMKKRYISQNEKADIKTEVQNSKGGAENGKESKLDSGDISCAAWLTHLNIYVPVLFYCRHH